MVYAGKVFFESPSRFNGYLEQNAFLCSHWNLYFALVSNLSPQRKNKKTIVLMFWLRGGGRIGGRVKLGLLERVAPKRNEKLWTGAFEKKKGGREVEQGRGRNEKADFISDKGTDNFRINRTVRWRWGSRLKYAWIHDYKNNDCVIFNLQNSLVHWLCLYRQNNLSGKRPNRPVANLPVVDFRS